MHGGDDSDDVAVASDGKRGRPLRGRPRSVRVRSDYFLPPPATVTVAALLGADVFPAASNATTEYFVRATTQFSFAPDDAV